jgi:hypothetical protein
MTRRRAIYVTIGVAVVSGIVAFVCAYNWPARVRAALEKKMVDGSIGAYLGLARCGETPTIRGNAMAAIESLRRGKLAPECRAIMVRARTGPACRDPDGTADGIRVEALAANRERDRAVFVFIDKNWRTVMVVVPLESSRGINDMAGFTARVEWAPEEEILRSAIAEDDSIVSVDGLALSQERGHPSIVVVLPRERSVAVGLRYPDGIYSNFVPLARLAEPNWVLFGTTRQAPINP